MSSWTLFSRLARFCCFWKVGYVPSDGLNVRRTVPFLEHERIRVEKFASVTTADRTWAFACPEQSKPLLRAWMYLLTLTSLGSQVDSQIWALSLHDSFENSGSSETGAPFGTIAATPWPVARSAFVRLFA